MHGQIVLNVRFSVFQRYAVLLEQRVHLKPRLEIE